jgi:hypothetical protein
VKVQLVIIKLPQVKKCNFNTCFLYRKLCAIIIRLLSLFDTMLNFVENLLENERDPRSGPMNDQDHSLSLSDPDRSLVLSHFLTNFVQNLASCHTVFKH